MRRWRSVEEETSELNMTPMLDVVFIMLIFFIVTASFVRESGIEVTRPAAQTATPQARAAIVIALSSKNEIWMNRRRVELAALPSLLAAAEASAPQSGVLIEADRAAATGVLVQVMDAVRRAGLAPVALGTLARDLP